MFLNPYPATGLECTTQFPRIREFLRFATCGISEAPLIDDAVGDVWKSSATTWRMSD
jgi:hypothetical protein